MKDNKCEDDGQALVDISQIKLKDLERNESNIIGWWILFK
jgi:hypothetical protein